MEKKTRKNGGVGEREGKEREPTDRSKRVHTIRVEADAWHERKRNVVDP